jgi:LysR family hydrogen peroxide-inducible transcriptional activator
VTPTIPQLRAFLAVAEHLHFREAAAALGVSQPALSAALASLEDNLGVQLVERTTRRVLLTEAGEALVAPAQAVVDAVEGFVDAARSGHRGLTGVLRIGVIPTVAPYLLPAALRAMRRLAPELEPQVHEEQTARLVTELVGGRLDVAVVALPVERPGLRETVLYDEDFVLVVPDSSPYAGRTQLPRSVLTELVPLLLLEEGHCLRDQALDLCRSQGIRDGESRAARATSLATVTQLVAAGLGSTLLPETAVAVETRRAALGVARFASPAPGRRIGLVHRASSARSYEYLQLAQILRVAVRRLPVRVGDDFT